MKFNVKYANCKEGLTDYNPDNNFVPQPFNDIRIKILYIIKMNILKI